MNKQIKIKKIIILKIIISFIVAKYLPSLSLVVKEILLDFSVSLISLVDLTDNKPAGIRYLLEKENATAIEQLPHHSRVPVPLDPIQRLGNLYHGIVQGPPTPTSYLEHEA